MRSPTRSRPFLVAGTLSSFGTIVTVKILGLGESVAVARIIGSSEYGLLALALSITTLGGTVATLGIPQALTKFLSGEIGNSREVARDVLGKTAKLITCTSVTVAVPLALLGAFALGSYYRETALGQLVVFGSALMAISGPLSLMISALHGMKRITEMNAITVVGALVGLGLAVLLAFRFLSFGALVASYATTAIIGVLAFNRVSRLVRSLPNGLSEEKVQMRRLFNYGLPTLLSSLVVLPALYVVNSMVALVLGFQRLGSFAVALTLANILLFVSGAVGIPLFPLLSSLSVSDSNRGKALVPKVLRIVLFLSTPVAAGLITFGPVVIASTYGPEFLEGAPVLSVLSVALILSTLSGIVGSQIAGVGKMWLGLGLNAAWASGVVASSIILVPTIGLVGAGASILVGHVALLATAYATGRRALGLDFRPLRVPGIWASGWLLASAASSLLASELRFTVAAIVLLGIAATAFPLLTPEERSLATEVMFLLRLRKKPL